MSALTALPERVRLKLIGAWTLAVVALVVLSGCSTSAVRPQGEGTHAALRSDESASRVRDQGGAEEGMAALSDLSQPSAQCRNKVPLAIHYINVGQGASTFIRGPDGTTLLYDFGDSGDGPKIIAYLAREGISSGGAIDYAVLSHRHQDHYFGYKDLIDADIDVRVANFDSRSEPPTTPGVRDRWWTPASRSSAGTPKGIQPGDAIDLGCGARAFVAAANGVLFTGQSVPKAKKDENDRSVSLLIEYGDFQMTLDGDIGSGKEICTDHLTTQVAVQPAVMRALIKAKMVDPDEGVDVLHVAHHGSESSTSATYFNLARPTVAVASVGVDNKNYQYGHPRAAVVENVLLGPNRPDCVTAPPVWGFFQTEDGLDDPSDETQAKTSNAGISSGDITILTDGAGTFSVSGDNQVAQNTAQEFPSGLGKYVFANERVGSVGMALLASRPFTPFFDSVLNPRPVNFPAGASVDVTPEAPVLSSFDRNILNICGPFGSQVPDAREKLKSVLVAPSNAGILEDMQARLEAEGVVLGDDEGFVDEMARIWTRESGFQHVFCGERTGLGIGGLHYAARYADLQQSGAAGVAAKGVFEVLEHEVYTLPVEAQCGDRLCYASTKGYGIDLNAEDIFVRGVLALSEVGAVSGKHACRYDWMSDQGGQHSRSAVFVAKNGVIRTFYSVANPKSDLSKCGAVSASPVTLLDMPADESSCGE